MLFSHSSFIRCFAVVWALMCNATPNPPASAAYGTTIAILLDGYLYNSLIKTAALIIAIQWHESGFDSNAKSETDDYCLMQIHGRPDLQGNDIACVREGMRQLKWSIDACPKWPVALYAEGPSGCISKRAQRLSSEMTNLALMLQRGIDSP